MRLVAALLGLAACLGNAHRVDHADQRKSYQGQQESEEKTEAENTPSRKPLDVQEVCHFTLGRSRQFYIHGAFDLHWKYLEDHPTHKKGDEFIERWLQFVRCSHRGPTSGWECEASYRVDIDDLEQESRLNLFTVQLMVPRVASWAIDNSFQGVADLRWGPHRTWSISLTPTASHKATATVLYREPADGTAVAHATKTFECTTLNAE